MGTGWFLRLLGSMKGRAVDDGDARETELRRREDEIRRLEAAIQEHQDAAAASAHEKDRLDESRAVEGIVIDRVSHDLRAPLNVVLGSCELLLAASEASGKHDDDWLVISIQRSSKRLLDAADRLLDFSRFERGTFRTDRRPLHAAEVVAKEVREAEPFAADRGLELTLELDAPDVTVVADERSLGRALLNVLDALVEGAEQGAISVRVGCEEDSAVIALRHDRIGSDSDLVARLSIAAAGGAPARELAARYLGLALVRRYVDASGGSIEIATGEAEGTTVRLRLPLAPGEPMPVAPVTSGLAGVAVGEAPLVLVVEDDVDAQRLVQAALAPHYASVVAATATEARAALAEHGRGISAILMDISLRGSEDGLSITRWLRQQPEWRVVPVIAVTAHALPEDRRAARDAGCDDFIAKPFTRRELLLMLERVLLPTGGR